MLSVEVCARCSRRTAENGFAYHGDERIGFGKTQIELVQECFHRGLTRDDFVVCGVEEGIFNRDEEIEVSPDV